MQKIRQAIQAESESIIHLLKECAKWIKEKEINQWQYLLEGGEDGEIRDAIERGETYILLHENEIRGTFTISDCQNEWDEHIFGPDIENNSLYIHRLAIHPALIGQRMGPILLEWIQKTFNQEKEWLKLDCVASNMKLVTFYCDNGFEHIGETDGHMKFRKRFGK
ncbi:GNAT family N-acetyltransferase [Bacillus sp. BGMRC 2118]|nr:GNAT family N-acetyltransferase [Bacillus sp. BGMRC 2118]